MRQDRLDVGLVRQAVGEAHHYPRALLRKGVDAHFLASGGQRQRNASERRHGRIWLVIRAEYDNVHGVARPEVIAQPGVRRRVGHGGNLGKARQVITTGEFGELALYSAADCVFHRIAIWSLASVTVVMRSPLLIVAPGRTPGRAATIALWLPW
ncbi:hypothetical protein D3C81_1395050 [compost metagenome]